jgi:hypothetical protein
LALLSLEDRARIDDLLAAYVLCLDVDDLDGMVNLFSPGGEFRTYGTAFVGEHGLRRMLNSAPKGLHLAGRSLITPADFGATVRSQLVFFPADREPPRLAVYDDEVVQHKGDWKFQVRDCRFLNANGVLGPKP